MFDRRTGGGHVRQKLGDYDRAVGAGVTVVPLLVETFGGCAPPLMSALQRAADWRQNKLTSSEYDETTWSARTWLPFVSQRLQSGSPWRRSWRRRRRWRRRSACRWRPTPACSELTLTGCDAPAG